jgi:hypothetical protein
MLQYAEGLPLDQVGWGRASPRTLEEVSRLHALLFDIHARPRYMARRIGGPMARRISGILAAKDAPAVNVFVGHDNNIAALASLIGAHFKMDGYGQDDPPIGGALELQVLVDGQGRRFVAAYYEAQTPDQLRRLAPLSLAPAGSARAGTGLPCARRAACRLPAGRLPGRLLGLALGERARQPGGGGRGLAQQQHAGGVAVQAVDQLGPVDPLAPGAEQLVDMVGGLGAALHGQAGRLVQRQDLLVLVQHQRLGEGDVALGQRLLLVRIGGVGQRRHPHLAAGRQLGVGLDPRAVDPHLTRAEQLVELDMVQVRPAALEPAVHPDAVLAIVHIERTYFLHAANILRAIKRPAKTAATDRITLAVV